jgi:protein TonB
MVRLLISLLLGVAVTFGLFVFMAALIGGGPKRHEAGAPTPVIDIVMDKPKSSVQERRRVPPPPPPPPKQPPKAPPAEPDPVDNSAPGISLDVPAVDISSDAGGMASPTMINKEGDATPKVRIPPDYPPEAARDGIQGWVKLQFTIGTDGRPKDIEVLEADPKRVFDRNAKRALRKWVYDPKFEDGKAVEQPGIIVQLDFSLEGDK